MKSTNSFYETLGLKLRACRKAKNVTLAELAENLNKSLSTVSKYEKGEIAIDVEVLADYCAYLDLDMAYILPVTKKTAQNTKMERYQEHSIDQLYVYFYKPEGNLLRTCVIENNNATLKAVMYYDVHDLSDIYDCSFIYFGKVVYTDTNIYFVGQNAAPPYDILTLSIPNMSSPNSSTGKGYRPGLMNTLTFYYQMVSIKCIVSREPITDKKLLLDKLLLTPEEIKWVKNSNVFNIFI